MLHQHEYVNEKLHEFELEALARRSMTDSPRPRPRPVVGPIVFLAGRTLKRFGGRIETWATPEVRPSPELPS